MEWNPNTTATKGLEWLPHTRSFYRLDGPGKAVALSILNTTSQAIGGFVLTVPYQVTGHSVTGSPLGVVEVFDNEDGAIDLTTLATTTYRPNEDVSGTGAAAWREDDNTTTTIFSEIDESTLDTTDYIKVDETAGVLTTQTYAGRVGSAGFGAGLRVLAVTVTAVVSRTAGYATRFRLGLDISGTRFWSPYFSPAADTNQTISYTWLYNPQALRPWRIADVQAFDAGDEYLIETEVRSNEARVYQAYMDVVNCTENRIAVGAFSLVSTNVGQQLFTSLTTPTGGTWTKDAAGRHLYLIRRLSSTGAFSLNLSEADDPPPSATGYFPTINPTYGYVSATGDASPKVLGLILRTTAPADSVDSQPFVTIADRTQINGTIPFSALSDGGVYSGLVAQMEFSNAAATGYKILRFLVAKRDGVTADLSIKIKRRSDNTQFGSTVTLTAAEWDALPDLGAAGFKLVEKTLATAATLAAGTQYYVDWSSTQAAPTGLTVWQVLGVFVAQGVMTYGENASFGGTTDQATGNIEATFVEFPFTLATQPTAPASFTATLTNLTVPTTVRGATVVRYAALTWTATALSASFDHYEIERSEDGGTTWTCVAKITTEASAAWSDIESKRNTAVTYRIRVVRTDNAFSAWSTSSAITPTAVNDEMIFTTNESTALTVAVDYAKAVPYEFLTETERVLRRIYGRDFQVAFSPTEDRGVRFSVPVTIHAGSTPTSPGLPVFAALRALATADVPYVCVLDHRGNRLYAALQVPDGTHRRAGQIYVANVVVTQTIDVPDPYEA